MPDRPFIPAPNGGGWGEAATLLNAGIQAWDQNRRYQQDQEQGLIAKGLMKDTRETVPSEDEETYGQPVANPTYGKIIRQPLEEQNYQRTLREGQAGSDESDQKRDSIAGLLRQAGMDDSNVKNMSGTQAEQYWNNAKTDVSGEYGVRGRQARLDIQRGNQAVKAADTFDKDHILTQLTQQQQQIRRDTHTLETAETMTPQIFNEINLGIANAISGGKAAAVTTQGKVEYDSLALDYTRLKQRISNNPQDIGSPEVKKYTADILKRLDDAYSNNLYEQAQRLKNGRAGAYTNNPAAMNVLNDKAASYKQAEPQGLVDQNAATPSQGGGKIPTFEEFKAMKKAGKL